MTGGKTREKRITEIMTDIVNNLSEKGPHRLREMAEKYRPKNEVGLCQIAFSRLEAEGIIEKRSDGKWELSNEY